MHLENNTYCKMKNKQNSKMSIKNCCLYSNFYIKDGYIYAQKNTEIKSQWNNVRYAFKKIITILF
jgi:hypothetical protein